MFYGCFMTNIFSLKWVFSNSDLMNFPGGSQRRCQWSRRWGSPILIAGWSLRLTFWGGIWTWLEIILVAHPARDGKSSSRADAFAWFCWGTQKLRGGSGFRTSVRLLTVLNAHSFPSLPARCPVGSSGGQRAPFLPALLVVFFSSSKMDVFVFVGMTYI